MSAGHPNAAHVAAGFFWAAVFGGVGLSLATACTGGGGGGSGGIVGTAGGYEPPGSASDPGGPNGTRPGPEPGGPGGYEPGSSGGSEAPPTPIGTGSGGSCSYCGKSYSCVYNAEGITGMETISLGPAEGNSCPIEEQPGIFSCDGTAEAYDGGMVTWVSDGNGGFTFTVDGNTLDCTPATSGGSSSSGGVAEAFDGG